MPEVIYKFLTIDHVEHAIAGMVSDFFRDYPDPTPAYQYLDGLRGRGKLESALAQPQQSFGGEYLYATIFEMAAALWRSLTLNHPFIDGNKRMGSICCHLFMAINGYWIVAPQREVVATCVAIASGSPGTDGTTVAEWLERNTVRLVDLAREPGIDLPRLMANAANEPRYTLLASEALRELIAAMD